MPMNKRITDLTDFTSVLPYASEMFGVYQPMIGWRSKRLARRQSVGLTDTRRSLLQAFAASYVGVADSTFSIADCSAQIRSIEIGRLASSRLIESSDSLLMRAIAATLPKDGPPPPEAWQDFINTARLQSLLNTTVSSGYVTAYQEQCRLLHSPTPAGFLEDRLAGAEAYLRVQKAEENLVSTFNQRVDEDSALAGALLGLIEKQMFSQLESLFYIAPPPDPSAASTQIAAILSSDDPFATFDPNRDIKNVNLSPLGIVHLFRQYFFELDTFLASPTGHVWLSPGSTVELIEVSTRRVYVEKTVEQALETTQKSESSTTDQDEISEAVKQDNKSDLKLGASLTVNQSWGTGNATATGSLNMNATQDTARETTHKRMREQTAKLSSEIKQSYKSTFKTITETTDTSSKRYVLNNTTSELINYELRRKMRQVGVQVQDIGSYLCWETFVDEPGLDLGLANLVNIAKPADLEPVPDQGQILMPSDKTVPFTANVTWNFDNTPHKNGPDGFFPLGTANIPPGPDGYDLKYPDNGHIDVFQVSGSGKDFSGVTLFKGMLSRTSASISVGPVIPDGFQWDNTINWVVGGVVTYTPGADARNAVNAANAAKLVAGQAANAENERKTREAFVTAVKERIEDASGISARKYEDLREEERIVVYRKLIGVLMSEALYGMPESISNGRTRHTMSELLNSIFDIDKMLYFVAPEWWKPRPHYHQYLANQTNDAIFAGNLTNWSDLEPRADNYYITEKSQYARMGSSIGWLLQLDGDDLRNAFLNAPWVKAVIPIRPGKELEALNWLQHMNVEGTDGLGDLYEGTADEIAKIQAALGVAQVTIGDAIKYLCAQVAEKYRQSLVVGRYPSEEINDDNKVSATPVDKVYEHGFYPLASSFRAVTSEPYEVFDQWIEVLPTDQVVPVEVKYDPKTGRQL